MPNYHHRHVLSDEDDQNPCPICLRGYKDGEEITVLNHQHHHVLSDEHYENP